MRATARVVAVADGSGRTRLETLRGEPPLLPRRTGPGVGEAVQVHLVGGAAGPLGGDDLALHIEVGPGAALSVRTVAASVALPGRDGRRSRMRVTAVVAEGGWLEWRPEPLIAAAGCHHRSESTVELCAGAGLSWWEELVWGRYGEEGGDLVAHTTVRLDGRALYVNELALGRGAPGWAGPAVLGGARAIRNHLRVDPDATDPDATDPAPDADPIAAERGWRTAHLRLAGPGVLTTAVAVGGGRDG